MNTAWAIGFIVGILIVAVICTVAAMVARKKGLGKGNFDERQQVIRGRAFTWAYATLLVYLAVWMVLRTMELPFFMQSLSVLLGVLLSVAVFVGYCIFRDAYFKASESPRVWIGVISAVGLLNLGIGLIRLFREATLEERLCENANLFVGALLVFTLVCILIKRAIDRRSEAE